MWVEGYHFPLARSFSRSWAFARFSRADAAAFVWTGRWWNGACELAWQSPWLHCSLQLFRCFSLQFTARVEVAGGMLFASKVVLDHIAVPDWPAAEVAAELTATLLLCDRSQLTASRSVFLSGGGVLLGFNNGASAWALREGSLLPLSELALRAESAESVHSGGISSQAHLGSSFEDAGGGKIDFYPLHFGRRYHYLFPHEQGQLVYGEFDGIWQGPGGEGLTLQGSPGFIDTRLWTAP